MAHRVLTGAGFRCNWGSWLANEVFEHLLGCQEVAARRRCGPCCGAINDSTDLSPP